MKKYCILGLLFMYSQFSHAGLVTLKVTDLFLYSTGLSNNAISLVIDTATPVTRLTDVVGEFDNAIQSGFFLAGSDKYDISLTSVNTIAVRDAGTPRLNITGNMTDALGNVESFLLRFDYYSNTSLASLSFLDFDATAFEIFFDMGASIYTRGNFEISPVIDGANVPEPTALILLMLGLAGVFGVRRLKK